MPPWCCDRAEVKRGGWIVAVAVVAFAAILIARMPAAWLIPTSGPQALCASVEGSLWSGSCSALTIAHNPIGDVSWELKPLRLFAGELAAHANASHGAAQASAEVALSFGEKITARHLVGDLPLDPGIIPGLPATLRGRAHFELPLARMQHGVVTQLEGRIEVHDLEDLSGAATPLGSYVIEFPAGASGEPLGKLHDLEGPWRSRAPCASRASRDSSSTEKSPRAPAHRPSSSTTSASSVPRMPWDGAPFR